MDKENLIKCLEKHLKWVKGEEGGKQANLSSADLRRADLRRADLRWADLSGADLSGANIKIFHGGKWPAFIDPELIRIGCKLFKVSEWDGFSDEIIRGMAIGALDYWKENKGIIMAIAKQLQEKFPDNWAAQ